VHQLQVRPCWRLRIIQIVQRVFNEPEYLRCPLEIEDLIAVVVSSRQCLAAGAADRLDLIYVELKKNSCWGAEYQSAERTNSAVAVRKSLVNSAKASHIVMLSSY
jgi:hypothetical protein